MKKTSQKRQKHFNLTDLKIFASYQHIFISMIPSIPIKSLLVKTKNIKKICTYAEIIQIQWVLIAKSIILPRDLIII